MTTPTTTPPARRPKSWHQRAGKPVRVWMVILILIGLLHWLVPDGRWLLVHVFTIGLVANSVLLWSQTLAERFLGYHLPETRRRPQLVRIYLLNAGLVVTIAGMMADLWMVTLVGAVLIGLVVAWHAIALSLLIREAQAFRLADGQARAEHAMSVWFFVASAALLPVGAGFGVALAYGFGDPVQAGLLVAHQCMNILGFLCLAAAGVLTVLYPRMLGDSGATARRRPAALALALVGIAVTTAGALADLPVVAAVGVAVYLVAWIVVVIPLAKAAIKNPPNSYASASITAALLWLLGSLTAYAVVMLTGPFDQARITLLTVPFLAGFAGQLLIGTMSHLLPTMMGGGAVTAAGSAEMNRWWVWRVTVINLGLVVWLLPVASWVKVAVSAVVMAAYVAFLPIMIRSAVAAMRVRRSAQQSASDEAAESGAAPTVAPPRRGQQAVAAVATIALAIALGTALGGGSNTGGDSAAGVVPTGQTTTVSIDAVHMRFTPDTVTVPAGNRLVITVRNTDSMVHDLVLANGRSTGRLAPGQSGSVDAGVIGRAVEGWCSIVGHRQQGMVFHIRTAGGPAAAAPGASTSARAPAVDLMRAPEPGFAARDARLQPAPGGTVHRYTFEATELPGEVAPGVRQTLWTYNGKVMGPPLRGRLGDVFEITLVNHGTMSHSVDFHAGMVSPDENMRDIAPGQSLVYRFRAEHTGIWLYHCATAPMPVHLAAGMFGAVIIDPPDLSAVSAEYLLTQSEWFLGPAGGPIDAAKTAAGAPDLVMFNGYANQYVYRPLHARVGDRIRMWVLDAGPNEPLSFHVIGTQFDTVYKEGAYLLRPSDPGTGGSQVLDLAAAQGGFVEMTFAEPGTYTFLNHRMVDGDRGAMGKIIVDR